MMENLGITKGDKIELESQFNLKKGNFCKLQPFKQESMDKIATIGFKCTLEQSLVHYSVLSKNERIVVEFNHFPYEFIIKEIKPSDPISILGSTDLEIEFDEPLESNASKKCDDISSGNDIISNDVTEERENSSSLGLVENYNDKKKINGSEDIDGALLKELGVPLDYDEQTQLAAMIMEDRKIQKEQENESELIEETNNNNNNKEEQEQQELPEQRGPNDIECKNCGKFVNSMSIQMHEIHCFRKFIRCKICNKGIRKEIERQHFEENHEEKTCLLCNEVLIGSISLDLHNANECKLRLIQCVYCDRTDIAAIDYEQHEKECKESTVKCDVCGQEYILKDKFSHKCGVECVLCNERISDSNDQLLHLLTSCKERRAICNYCGVFRTCIDMEQHRNFCGSRSEKCTECDQFVSLRNMEAHKQSNCELFKNVIKKKKKNKRQRKEKSVDSIQAKLQSLEI